MANPFARFRDKIPPGLLAPFRRRWHWKDVTIALLGVAVFVLSIVAFGERLSAALPSWLAFGRSGEPVAVFDVVMDREGRQFVDVLFDRPLGEGRVDEILEPAPATIQPALAGTWRWQDTNALRFQPSGGFPMASELTINLIPERLLKEGQYFEGDTELSLVTDQFLVEAVDVQEEPALEGKAKVVFRGEIRFNYPVNPEMLAGKVRLLDPTESEPVEVELETEWWSPAIGFRTAAVQKRRDERTLQLVIDRELTPAEGNVQLKEEHRQEIQLGSSERLAVWGVETAPGERESVVRVRFSSPISAAVASQYLTIEPAVRYRPFAERNVLVLTGELRPGSAYKLTIGKGMPATDDAVLPEAYIAEVKLPDLKPWVAFQSQGMFLSASGNHTVAIETVNVDQVQLAIDRVYLNNLFFFFQYGGFFDGETTWFGGGMQRALGDRLVEKGFDVRRAKNRTVTTPLTLDRHLPKGENGLFRVVVGKPGEGEGVQRWLLLTDLGVVAKRGRGELMVWVSSLQSLAPVAGARVTLLSDQNQPIGQGTTDGDGLWRLPASAELDRKTPYLVTVERGDDFTFLLLDQMRIDPTGLDVGGAEAPGEGYTAFLYGERDLYRPGETVEGLAVVRDGSLRPPPPMPVRLRHLDPQGRDRGTERLDLDARGLAELDLALSEAALTGQHTLELLAGESVIGQYRFQVEEFVPDRIKVEIEPPQGAVGPGQELAYQVAGLYLFGAPAAALPVETRVTLVDSTFTPEGFAGFSFRNPERQLDDREVLATEGVLDDEGRRGFSVTMPSRTPVPSSLEAVVTARVQEQGGRGVAALRRVPVHPYTAYVGLRRVGEEGAVEPGREAAFEIVAVTPDGKETARKGLRADLFLDRWNTVLRRTPGGGFRYETTRDPVLVDTRAIPAGAGRGRVGFAPRQVGSYRVVISDPDTQASSSAEFYVSGWGYSAWALKDPARIELVLDREGDAGDYAPGETARVQVRAPFPGKLLVTVERDRVFWTSVHRLEGNTATIEVPIRDDFRPNAYVTATLVRAVGDLEPGGVGRAFGAVPLPVDRNANRLQVAIEAPAEMRPDRELAVGVRTEPGAVVTVAAVDEGILQLVAQKTPEPFEHFYRKLALGTSSYDTFSLVLPEVAPERAAGGGEGADGMAQYARTEGIRRVEPVAFWSGPVEAGPDGLARVAFRVPEFQGALRIMAVAIGGREFGSTSRMTRVRDPIVLLPTFPRILSFNERLGVPVTVRNDTGKAGPIQVSLAAQGPVKIAGPAAQSVEVPVGRERTVSFTVETGAVSGDARFVVSAQGNGERSKATTNVSIRPDLPVATLEDAGAVTERVMRWPARDAARFRPETLRRELAIGPTPLLQFTGKLEDLLNYPYGCLEQTVSTAFPLLYLGDLAKRLEPKLFEKGDPNAYVREAMSRMSTMQLYDGGFALWPGGDTTHPWSTIWAAHFLVEARRAGHPVEDYLLNGALNALSGMVRAKSTYGSDELQRTVYALYVLARAGRADLGTMDFLRDKHARAMGPESKALLATAYAAVGNRRALDSLLAGLEEIERVERQTGGNFQSGIRNRAIVLLALLDAAPQSPRVPVLVDRLARDSREATQWTTQEAGWTLLALGQFVKRQTAQPPVAGTVFVGNERIGTFSTKDTAVFRDIRGTEPVRIELAQGFRPGAAYFSLRTRGVPTDEAFTPSASGLEVERQLLNREGQPIDLGNIRQGDLVAIKVRVRSTVGPIENVAVVNLLPSGLEVENPRLTTTEALPWVTDANMEIDYLDLRDDRILVFSDLPADSWVNVYALARAVAPGTFRLPPIRAEAMYNPSLAATGERGTVEVKVRD